MKHFILIISLLLTFLPFHSKGQQVVEMGPMIGGSYYIGELNPYWHFNQNTNLAAGLVFRKSLNSRYAVKFNGFYGKVEGSDHLANNPFRKNRNLHFKSNIIEIGGNIEMNFFEYQTGENTEPYTPYIFVGLAYFRMNPKAQYNGEWYELQPLGTEGQGTSAKPNTKKYSLDQIAIPFGLGFKATLGSGVGLGIEWGFRKTYTDYIDDVSTSYSSKGVLAEENGELAAKLSDRRKENEFEGVPQEGVQRGNSETEDWYVFSGISLTFVLGGSSSECKPFR